MKNTKVISKTRGKKVIGCLLMGALAATSIVTLVACTNPITGAVNAMKAKEVYSMSAVTSMEYLTSSNNNKVKAMQSMSVQNVADTVTSRPSEITDKTMETLGQFMGMFEGMLLGDGGSQAETVPTPEADGEYSKYKTKIVMSMPTLGGAPVEYTMYYTETAEGEEVSPDTNPVDTVADEDVDSKDKEEEEEVEVSTKLTGVIVMGDVVSEIIGSKTVETEGTGANAETETEVEFTTKIDDKNWVTVKEEKELNEIEYEYTIVTDGVESITAIEYENEAGKEELSLELEDANGVEKEYSVQVIEKDGLKLFEVGYEDEEAGTEVDIIVTPLDDGTYKYEFENGHIEIK